MIRTAPPAGEHPRWLARETGTAGRGERQLRSAELAAPRGPALGVGNSAEELETFPAVLVPSCCSRLIRSGFPPSETAALCCQQVESGVRQEAKEC